MSTIAGYRSPVNLPIGQTPLTGDSELFEEMTEVYNAIHLINQYLDKLRIGIAGGGSGQAPNETLPFNRFYVSKALAPITAGMAVSPSATTGTNGAIPGCLSSGITNPSALSQFCGIALTDAVTGADFRVGVGPAAIAVPGIASGNYVYAYASRASNGAFALDGKLYTSNPGAKSAGGGTVYPIPVGIGITTGYALIGQLLWR